MGHCDLSGEPRGGEKSHIVGMIPVALLEGISINIEGFVLHLARSLKVGPIYRLRGRCIGE
jgi:hypothetical protein